MNSKILIIWLELQRHVPKSKTITILCLIFFSNLLDIIGLGAIFPLLDILLDSSKISKYQQFPIFDLIPSESFLIFTLLFLILFYLIKNIFLSLSTYKIFQAVFYLQNYFSKIYFKGLLYANYESHKSHDINKSASFLVNDIPLVCIQWYLPSMYVISDVTAVTIIFLCLWVLNPLLLLLILVIGGGLFGFVVVFSKKYSYKWGALRKEQDALKVDFFVNSLLHIKEIITFNKMPFYFDKFSRANEISSRSGMLQSSAQTMPKFFIETIAVLILVTVILIMNLTGYVMESTVPTIGVYAMAAFRIIPSVNRLMQSVQMLQYGLDSAHTLIEKIKPDVGSVSNVSDTEVIKPFFNKLELRDLNYFYPNSNKKILQNLSLEIFKGCKIAIIGESGSGKSTLIDILLGLNKPVSGEVFLNGESIFSNIENWRSIIGYVPQNFHLTSDSLLENVTFSNSSSEINDPILELILDVTGARKILASKSDGESLGRAGLKISGGQKQRIAIARALFRNPSVLIFDEATSALDHESESEILNSIVSKFEDLTIISITHRIHDHNFYDFVYSLSDGRLTEVNNS